MDSARFGKQPALIAVLALLLTVVSSVAGASQRSPVEGVVADYYGAFDVIFEADEDGGDDPGSCPIVALQPRLGVGDNPQCALAADPFEPFLPDLRNRSPPSTPL